MAPVIARSGSTAYLRRVIAALSRLLALVALVLMPVGMGVAPAAAYAPQAAAEGRHCGGTEEGAPDAPSAPAAGCTTGCAAVAPDLPRAGPAKLMPRQAPPATFIAAIAGIEPDIATPPPKVA